MVLDIDSIARKVQVLKDRHAVRDARMATMLAIRKGDGQLLS